MPPHAFRRGGLGRLEIVGRRSEPGLWRRIVLGRRDDDHHRRKILGGRRKRRRTGDQRQRSGTSNSVRLRISWVRFAHGAARPASAPARGESHLERPSQFAPSMARLRTYTAIRRANSSAPFHTERARPLVVVDPQACDEAIDRRDSFPTHTAREVRGDRERLRPALGVAA
jgi:hypothetical protein